MEIAAKLHSNFDSRTAAVDRLVLSRFPELTNVALLAVGGYGRKEMFPCSDVDLLILQPKEEADPVLFNAIATFLQELWDAGLRVSQSVRTVADCTSVDPENLELTISLLDHRYLAGDEAVYERLAQSLSELFRRKRQEILRNLAQLTVARHNHYQNTIFHLEPNLKDGPGGLRDFQVVRWFARLKTNPESAANLSVPAAHIGHLRWELHESSGRDHNILDFEAQEQIASDSDVTPDELMGAFYRNARVLQRAVLREVESEEVQDTAIFSRFRDQSQRLSDGEFSVSRGFVSVRDPNHDLSRLFEFVARHNVRLSPDTNRRIRAALLGLKMFSWKQLHAILCLPYAATALREMHEAGLLTLLFPELSDIECLVIRDFYHQYTVDEHTLVAIGNLLGLRDADAGPFSELAREHSDLSLLIFALLFHDVGKAGDAGGHAESSARRAISALNRFELPQADRDAVLFLIRSHLDMSATMNARDITDPLTVRAMADRAGTVENLKLLTLLTYADISAVNTSAMSPWRATLLWQLYSATYRELMRELETDRVHVDSPFLEGLPVRYLRTHSQADIQAHIRMSRFTTSIELERKGTVYLLTAVTPDRPALFASIVGAISSFGMNILKAEAFSNAKGVVIDTFTFADPFRTLELNPGESETLKRIVERAATGKEDVAQLLKKRPAPRFSAYEPHISFDNDVSETSTLIHLVAADRPGLLYDVASALSAGGRNIEVVLVDTQGRKAVDVFYVTPKLKPEEFESWSSKLAELF
jgi:[protein-PII] uridylyltransferase